MADRTAPFGRLLTAVITPFDEAGAVDHDAFWRLVRHLGDNGSDGVVVAGTTGESPTLSSDEKAALYATAVDAAGSRMTVVAGTGTYDTAESIELTRRAADAGCHAAMAVTPYYSKPPQEGLFRHFVAIAEATDLPLVLYNIPGRTARLIEVDTLARLGAHPKIVAVKDAVDDIEFTRHTLEAVGDDMAVYSGSDLMTLDLVSAGGVGVISVASHLVGPRIAEMIAAVLAGDPRAKAIDDALTPLCEALFVEPNPMPLKAAMNRWWGPVGEPRLPLIPASGETLELIGRAIEAAAAP